MYKKLLLSAMLLAFCLSMPVMAKDGNYNQSNEIDWFYVGVSNPEIKAVFFTNTILDDNSIIKKRLPVVEVPAETFAKFYNLNIDDLPKGLKLGDLMETFLLYAAYKNNIGFEKPAIPAGFEPVLEELFKVTPPQPVENAFDNMTIY